MLNQSITSHGGGAVAQYLRHWRALDLLRGGTFIAVFLLAWITLDPFADLRALPSKDLTGGNQTLTYFVFALLLVLTVSLAARDNMPALASLITPGFVLFVGWIFLTVVFSLDPSTSIRRFALTICAVAVAATLMLLPRSQDELVRWFSIAALTLLVVCYLGLLLAPHLSIHLAADAREQELAGNWRGSFGHKNLAATVMSMLLFLGIYIGRSGAWLSGVAIVSMTSLFLVHSGGKSSLTLCAAVLLVTSTTSLIRSFWLRALLLLAPLLVLNVLSVGSVIFTDLAQIAKLLPLDSTFTGRTDIWIFAVQAAQERLAMGYGFASFWGSSAIQNLPEGKEWAAFASHSHNGYLDMALQTGLPGLALLIWVLVINPLQNFHAADRGGNNGPLAMALLRIWLFGLYLSSMESFFLDRANPSWFTFLFAVFGLHYLARFRVAESRTSRLTSS